MRMITRLMRAQCTRRLLWPFCAVALVASCVDGPFARVNPHDPAFEYTLELRVSRDTVTPLNPVVLVQLVTDPLIVGYRPIYEADSPFLSHLGDGVFLLNTPPTGVFAVNITASIDGTRSVSRVIHRAPAP